MNSLFNCVTSMGNNLMVKVRCGLGSGNHYPRTRVSIVRWNLKEVGGKVSV